MNVTFITETQYYQLTELSSPKNSKWRVRFAWITSFMFWISLFMGFGFTTVTYTEDYLWRFNYSYDDYEMWIQFICLGIGILSFISFLVMGMIERFSLERRVVNQLQWIDLAVFCNWIFIPWCLDMILGSGMLFFSFISFVIAGILLNLKRSTLIGFQAPSQKTLLLVMVIGSLFYIPIVDGAASEITVALGIDTYSSREDGISEALQVNVEKTDKDESVYEQEDKSKEDESSKSNSANDGSEGFLAFYSIIFFLLSIVTVCFIGPIAEEILFRGYLQTLFTNHVDRKWSVAITAFIFALYHIDIPMFLPLFLSGLILGMVRETFGSVWASSFLHIFMNTISSVGDIFR